MQKPEVDFRSSGSALRVVMDWILENPIQIQIYGLDFKFKSIFFYETNLDFYKIQIQIFGLDSKSKSLFFIKPIWIYKNPNLIQIHIFIKQINWILNLNLYFLKKLT